MARFMRKGITKVFWVPTISDMSAPTAVEITAGTELTEEISDISGFTFSNSPINTPDMSTAFVNSIPGEDSVDQSSMDFYEEKGSNPIKTALAKGTTGYVVFFATGIAGTTPAAGDKADAWPSIVASNSRVYTAANEAAKYHVVFAPTAPPKEAALV